MHEYTIISKFDVAEEQLLHAIELYIEGEYIISSITLSGAAEEILGRLVNEEEKEKNKDIFKIFIHADRPLNDFEMPEHLWDKLIRIP